MTLNSNDLLRHYYFYFFGLQSSSNLRLDECQFWGRGNLSEKAVILDVGAPPENFDGRGNPKA